MCFSLFQHKEKNYRNYINAHYKVILKYTEHDIFHFERNEKWSLSYFYYFFKGPSHHYYLLFNKDNILMLEIFHTIFIMFKSKMFLYQKELFI